MRPFPAVSRRFYARTVPGHREGVQGVLAGISLRITRVIPVAHLLTRKAFSLGVLAMVYNWCAEPFADSERIASSYSEACMA